MKKLVLICIAAFGLTLASCSKEKDCSCVIENMSASSTTEAKIKDGDCADLNTTTTTTDVMGTRITTTTTCTEK